MISLRLGSSYRTRNFCPALAALVSPVQNIFSSPYIISLHLQAGQAIVPGRLSLNICFLGWPWLGWCVFIILPQFKWEVQVRCNLNLSVILSAKQCSGTGIRDTVPFGPRIRDLGSGIGFFRIPYFGSRILIQYFWELNDNFLGRKFYNSL